MCLSPLPDTFNSHSPPNQFLQQINKWNCSWEKKMNLAPLLATPPTHTHLSMVVLTIPGQPWFPYPSCQLTADVGTSLCSLIWPQPAGSRATPVAPDCSINSTYQSMCTSTSTCFTQRMRSLGNRGTYTKCPFSLFFSDPIISWCQWQTSTQSSFWLLKFMPYPPLVTSCIK